MRAARIHNYDGVGNITLEDISRPQPEAGKVLVRVEASSINPIDGAIREGRMARMLPVQPPFTLGLDFSGAVETPGEGVEGFSRGDRVYGEASVRIGGSGAFAEYALVPKEHIAKMPSNLDFIEAAAIPLTGSSAVQALTEHMQLRAGQRILIHGAAGGIGTVAVQIAKDIGAYVVATAKGEGISYVRGLGADQVIDYSAQPFEDASSGFDAVFVTVPGDTFERSLRVMKPGAVIVSMLQADVDRAKGQGFRAVSQFTKVTTGHLDKLRSFVESGAVTVHIETGFSLGEIKEAFLAKETGDIKGKVGVAIGEEARMQLEKVTAPAMQMSTP